MNQLLQDLNLYPETIIYKDIIYVKRSDFVSIPEANIVECEYQTIINNRIKSFDILKEDYPDFNLRERPKESFIAMKPSYFWRRVKKGQIKIL